MSGFSNVKEVPQLNSRCRDADGFLGTVLYVGPVASAKKQTEVYVGVEWDDESRGKHDGSVISRETNQIVRHFKCESSSPNAGSFVKPSKLDFGVSFASTLGDRYVKPDAPLLAPNDKFEGCFARTKSGRGKQVEFFGERKIRERQQVGDITKVALRGEGVSHAGAQPEELKAQAGHLIEVDLQGNMLWEWEEVGKIINQLEGLEALHLNSNRLMNPVPLPPTLERAASTGGFTSLTRLVLNKTGIKGWEALAILGDVFPALSELYVAQNDLSDVDIVATSSGGRVGGFSKLKLLDISECGLTAWSQVKVFGAMEGLETLIVNGNEIQDTKEAEEGEFANLKSLQLSGTKIKDWGAVDNLNSFKELRGLRFNNCPVTSTMGASEARGIVIARVERVEFLNASVVTTKERGDAEKIYVRRVAREVTMQAGSGGDGGGEEDLEKAEAVLRKHPRFKHLKEVHKASMVPLGDGGGTGSLGQDTINVTVQSMAAGSCTMEAIRKRVPSGLQVGRLKQMCKRAFKLDPDLQVLHFRADKGSLMAELGSGGEEDDELTLAYFGVTDGSMIFMNEVDLKAKERERVAEEKRKLEEEGRGKEQEEEMLRMDGIKKMQIDQERRAVGHAAK